jgi:hypothetical protein
VSGTVVDDGVFICEGSPLARTAPERQKQTSPRPSRSDRLISTTATHPDNRVRCCSLLLRRQFIQSSLHRQLRVNIGESYLLDPCDHKRELIESQAVQRPVAAKAESVPSSVGGPISTVPSPRGDWWVQCYGCKHKQRVLVHGQRVRGTLGVGKSLLGLFPLNVKLFGKSLLFKISHTFATRSNCLRKSLDL